MRLRIGLLILLMASAFAVAIAKDVTLEGKYSFVLPASMSESEGRAIALERAMAQALADEFGTLISSEAWTDIVNDNSESDVYFRQLGNSLVKGEWIRTLSEPEYRKYVSPEGETVIEVFVKGKARALESAPIKLKAFVSLPNSKIESNRFNAGSRFILNFTTPVDGFLSIYIADENGMVTRLLPYAGEAVSSTPVVAMKEYLFFDSQEGFEEQYTFETDKKKERNIVYVLFSRNDYVRPIDKSGNDGLRVLRHENFLEWLSESRLIDRSLQVTLLPVLILNDN